jgi:hypothetical protein
MNEVKSGHPKTNPGEQRYEQAQPRADPGFEHRGATLLQNFFCVALPFFDWRRTHLATASVVPSQVIDRLH